MIGDPQGTELSIEQGDEQDTELGVEQDAEQDIERRERSR